MGGIGPAGSVGGPEQQFALKWNDFHTSILSSFRHLKDEEDFIDVTIACDGCSFTAHKVVLSACSPYFRSLLKANPCQHPIVILQDVREQDMEALLRFMYNGEVHIGQEQLPDFLKTAQTLQVRGLADVSTKDQHKLSNMSASIPWSSNTSGDDSQSQYNSKHSLNLDNPPPSKKSRSSESQNTRYSESPPASRENNTENLESKSDMLLSSQSQPDNAHSAQNSHPVKAASEPSSQIHSSNEDSDSYDDEASDAEGTDNGHTSITDLAQPKLEPPDYSMGDRSRNDSLMSPALFDSQRQRSGYPPMPFNLQDIAGLIPGLSAMHNNSQDNYVSVTSGCGGVPGSGTGGSCYSGVAEPKPICKECGRVYSSISNLKQHIANVHSTSPQWEPCSMCGKHFKTRQYLFNHLLQTHGIRQRGNRMSLPFSVPASSAVACPPHPNSQAQPHSQPHPHPTTSSHVGPVVAATSAVAAGSALGLPPPPSHLGSANAPQMCVPPSSVALTRLSSSASSFGPPLPLLPPPPSAPSIGPHSPIETSSDREVPHQATASSMGHKDRELSSAVEQCLQYLSSATK